MKCLIYTLILILFFINSSLGVLNRLRSKILFMDHHYEIKWLKLSNNYEDNLDNIIRILKKSKKGEEILYKALKRIRRNGSSLYQVIRPGSVSLNKLKIERIYDQKMHYRLISKVYIDRNLTVIEAVSDLAHELTHYSIQNYLNPYSDSFQPTNYIINMIEGEGGEVDAFLNECQVLKDIVPDYFYNKQNCQLIFNKNTQQFSKDKAIKEFYKIGKYKDEFLLDLYHLGGNHKELPFLSLEKSQFFSSAYSAPYPLAGLKEFNAIRNQVKINQEKLKIEIKSSIFN